MNKQEDLDFGVAVKHVSETAWMVAAYRAAESERKDRLFDDALALKLLARDGNKIEDLLQKTTPPGARDWFTWFMFIRTHLIDTAVMKLVAEGVDTVVNLACGLDTRPYRLALPSHVNWIEVDFLPVLQHKAQRLKDHAPRCRLERQAVDLCSPAERSALFEKIGLTSQKAMIITEGLLIYLPEESVRGLARDALHTRSCQYWLTESADASSFHRWKKLENDPTLLAPDDVRFKFLPEKFVAFFAPLGWSLDFKQSYEREALKLGRPRPALPLEDPAADADDYDFGIALLKAQRLGSII